MSELNTDAVADLAADTAVAAAPAKREIHRRTKEELIAFYEAKIEALRNGTATLREPKEVKEEFVPTVGEVYSFYFGRGDNRVLKTGRVLGIRTPGEGEKGGRIAKVMVGEGYEADIVGVFLSAFVPPVEVETDDSALLEGDEQPDGEDQE